MTRTGVSSSSVFLCFFNEQMRAGDNTVCPPSLYNSPFPREYAALSFIPVYRLGRSRSLVELSCHRRSLVPSSTAPPRPPLPLGSGKIGLTSPRLPRLLPDGTRLPRRPPRRGVLLSLEKRRPVAIAAAVVVVARRHRSRHPRKRTG